MEKENDIMDRSDFLFARPSFLRGMGDVLNIGAVGKIYNCSDSIEEADMKALQSDWKIVGNDMREALND